MSKLLLLAQKFNCFYLTGLATRDCKPFIVEGIQVGLIRPDVLQQLLKFPEVFIVTSGYVELNPAFRNYEERTIKVDEVLKKLRTEQKFVTLKGWRNEKLNFFKWYHNGTLTKPNLQSDSITPQQLNNAIRNAVKHA